MLTLARPTETSTPPSPLHRHPLSSVLLDVYLIYLVHCLLSQLLGLV